MDSLLNCPIKGVSLGESFRKVLLAQRSLLIFQRILSEKLSAFSCLRLAVQFDGRFPVQVHRYLGDGIGEDDGLDLSDLHAAHLDKVALLEFLDVFEERVQMIPALEE